MRFLILLMLSLGLTSEWGTSVSVRTPNDDIHPLDYELSVKLEDTNGKFRYLLNLSILYFKSSIFIIFFNKLNFSFFLFIILFKELNSILNFF